MRDTLHLTQSGGKRKRKTKVYSQLNPLIYSPIPQLLLKMERKGKLTNPALNAWGCQMKGQWMTADCQHNTRAPVITSWNCTNKGEKVGVQKTILVSCTAPHLGSPSCYFMQISSPYSICPFIYPFPWKPLEEPSCELKYLAKVIGSQRKILPFNKVKIIVLLLDCCVINTIFQQQKFSN